MLPMFLGGVIGILLSIVLTPALLLYRCWGLFFEDTSGKGDIHLAINLTTVAIAFGVLFFIGVVSGMGPALASRLDPVEALRYE